MIKKIAILSIIAIFTILLIYCTTDESTIIGPFGNTSKYISIESFSADKTLLYSNGDETIIKIKVLDVDKAPIIGLIIDFHAQFGSITESTTTDSSGIAFVTFVSDENIGENIITADTGIKKYTLTLQIVHYQPKYVEMYSESLVLLADGESSTTIVTVLKDSVGNPMPNITVLFTTTLGVLSSEAVITDDSGKATTLLTSATVEGIATVTMSAGIEKSIDIKFIKYLPAYVELSSVSSWIWADGESSTIITAVLKDSVGIPMSDMTVIFTTTLGALSSEAVATDGDGIATTVLTSATIEGVATVTATSYIITESVSVKFDSYIPSMIDISASPTTILADGLSNSTIIAIPKDRDGIIMPNLNVLFSTTHGILSDTTGRTDQGGSVTTKITSTGSPTDKTAKIKVSVADDTSIYEDIDIQFRGIMSTTHIDSSKMSTGGIYKAYIRTTLVEDTNGESVSGGAIYFSSPTGKMENVIVQTDEQGTARTTFIANVLPTNQNNVVITSELSSSSAVSSASEEFDIPGVEILVSTIDDEIMGDGVGYALIKATLREITGKAITGTRVDWETTLGTIKRQSQTNTTGHTIDTLMIESGVGQSTNVTIRANYGEYISGSDILTIIPPATTGNRIIIGAEPNTTDGPCVTFDSLRTCVYGLDEAGRIVFGTGGLSPIFGSPIYCGTAGDTWCYRICGQDVILAGAYGTRDIAVTAIFKDEFNNPISNQALSFWLTPADAQATICEQDIVPNSLGYSRVTLTYPIQSGGQLVRIWAGAPDGTQGSIDVVLPVITGE